MRASHRLERHWLAERNRRALDEAAAVAKRRLLVRLERGEDLGKLVSLRAIQTRRVSPVPVKLDYLLICNARSLMQAVDVLSDDARDFALHDQMRDRAMTAIWLRLRDRF